MDLAAELARFNPDPALTNWITGAVQTLVDQAQKQGAHASAELHTAQIKIQALTLELAHLRRMPLMCAAKPSPLSSAISFKKPGPVIWRPLKPNWPSKRH